MSPQQALHDESDRTCPIRGCDETGTHKVVDDNYPDPAIDASDDRYWEEVGEGTKGAIHAYRGPTIVKELWYCDEHWYEDIDI